MKRFLALPFLSSAVLLCAVFCFLPSVVAQTSEQPDPYKPTLDRLRSLSRESEAEWRYHADVPHPEDPTLNDSDWGVFTVKNISGPGGKHDNEEHWTGTRLLPPRVSIPGKNKN